MGVQTRRAKTRRVEKVLWKPPDWPWIKLNTDGAFGGTANMAGGGGLVRDHLGRCLEAFCSPLAAVTGLEAEVKALLEGILMAKTHGNCIWLEVDAEILCSLLDKGKLGPAYLRHDMVKIRVALREVSWRISHIRREGNKAADFLQLSGKIGS